MFEGLWAKISEKSARARTPPGIVLKTGADDIVAAASMPSPSDPLDRIAGLACVIEYTNSKGELSVRRVACRKLMAAKDILYLAAFCLDRQGYRRFRIDRISAVHDIDTGECAGDPGAFFAQFDVDERAKQGLNYGLSVKAYQELHALMVVATFIAKCDEEWHASERAEIEQMACCYWLRKECEHDIPIDEMMAYADRLAPDVESFWIALHKAVERPVTRRLVGEFATRVMAADGIHKSREIYWVGQLANELSA